jgi:hypothetical protein
VYNPPLPDSTIFQKFLIQNKLARDMLDGYQPYTVDFREAYHQALLDEPIKEESEDKAYEVLHLPSSRSRIRGIPPVHQQGTGKDSDNYWLPDSGTTTHMTPHISDLNAGSFKPHSGSIRLANNHRSTVIGQGNVTLLIRCYRTGELISWTLHDVLVVPT